MSKLVKLLNKEDKLEIYLEFAKHHYENNSDSIKDLEDIVDIEGKLNRVRNKIIKHLKKELNKRVN